MLEWICDLFLGIGSIFSGLEINLGMCVHLKIVKGKGDYCQNPKNRNTFYCALITAFL